MSQFVYFILEDVMFIKTESKLNVYRYYIIGLTVNVYHINAISYTYLIVITTLM